MLALSRAPRIRPGPAGLRRRSARRCGRAPRLGPSYSLARFIRTPINRKKDSLTPRSQTSSRRLGSAKVENLSDTNQTRLPMSASENPEAGPTNQTPMMTGRAWKTARVELTRKQCIQDSHAQNRRGEDGEHEGTRDPTQSVDQSTRGSVRASDHVLALSPPCARSARAGAVHRTSGSSPRFPWKLVPALGKGQRATPMEPGRSPGERAQPHRGHDSRYNSPVAWSNENSSAFRPHAMTVSSSASACSPYSSRKRPRKYVRFDAVVVVLLQPLVDPVDDGNPQHASGDQLLARQNARVGVRLPQSGEQQIALGDREHPEQFPRLDHGQQVVDLEDSSAASR